MYKIMKIVIDGNIGCGKTTLIKRLNDEIRIPIFLEPLQKWTTLLTLFYENPEKWAFAFNLEVLTSFHEWKENSFPAIYERSPLSCRYVFTQQNTDQKYIDELELAVFDKIYNELKWEPDVLIYLQTDPIICSKRIKDRGRDCEANIKQDYIEAIHKKYEEMIKKSSIKHVYIINGNRSKDIVFNEVLDIINRHNI